jgi:polyisoprenoid-binding protein YceI
MPIQRTVSPALLALSLLAVPFQVHAASVELRIDLDRSHIFAVTHGASLFSAEGPEHAIEATHWTLSLCLDIERPATPGAAAELEMPVSGLELDTEKARHDAGLGGALEAAETERLRARLLGPEGLDAEHHPSLHFKARTVLHPSAAYPLISGDLTLRGVTVPAMATMDITTAPDGKIHLVSHYVLNQSSFGIAVETVNGFNAVADQLDVTLDLWATSTGKACPAPAPTPPPSPPSQHR